MKKVLAAVIALTAFAATSNAQAVGSTTQSSATATIISPITITKAVDMNFGSIAASTGGVIELGHDGVRTVLSGGVTLSNINIAAVKAAAFDVTGAPGYTYAITLPSTDVILSNGAQSMPVNAFTSSIGATGTLDGVGAQSFTVGATLAVAANQAPGVYTNSAFDVTVNYN